MHTTFLFALLACSSVVKSAKPVDAFGRAHQLRISDKATQIEKDQVRALTREYRRAFFPGQPRPASWFATWMCFAVQVDENWKKARFTCKVKVLSRRISPNTLIGKTTGLSSSNSGCLLRCVTATVY